jgi:SAM-dependent methyltransferase
MTLPVLDFVLARLPRAPARVLEVGCGDGALTRALAQRDYHVVGIDPRAPEGPQFARIGIEALRAQTEFDVVLAVVSLHHVDDLAAAVERMADALRAPGMLLIDEFDREQLDEATTAWLWHQRRALAAIGAGPEPEGATVEEHHRSLHDGLAEIFTWSRVREALAARFEQQFEERVPYLYRYETDLALEPLERAMIERGAVRATGVRAAFRC